MKNKWLWLILALFVLGFGFRIYQKTQAGKDTGFNGKGKQAVPVDTASVKIMDMNDTGRFSGSLAARSQFVVAPKVAGQMSRLKVNIGDVVKKGQVIAELDDRLYRQDVAKAQAALDMAQATAEQSRQALARSEQDDANQQALLAKHYISQDAYNQAHDQYIADKAKNDIAQASLHSAQAALDAAQIELSYTKITADWNGSGSRVVGERFADEGSLLNAGAAIVSLLDIGTLTAVTDVIESDYNKLKAGMPAAITTDTYPGVTFPGSIARIAPMLQEASRQARVEIEIPNPQGKLKPGMFARVAIVYSHKTNVTAVPLTALCNNQGNRGVFLVNKSAGTVSFVKVQTGIQDGQMVEIISPPLSGIVVTLGQDQLDDGSAISLPGAKPGKGRGRKPGAGA